MWDPQNPLVLINSKILKEGDQIEGFKIQKIEKNSVDMTRNGVMYKALLE
jgi:hypothetical protein